MTTRSTRAVVLVVCGAAASGVAAFACGGDAPGTLGNRPVLGQGSSGEPGGGDAGGASSSSSSSSGGSSSGDAGSSGDGGTGARDLSANKALFFGASRCAQANVLLCEDFESGTIDKNVWQVNGDVPTIDGLQHARGAKALHVKKTGAGLSYLKTTKVFPVPNDTYFGRAFVRFVQMPSTPAMGYAHWTFIAASGTGTTGEIRIGGQLQNGKNLFGVGTDSGGDPNGTGDWTNSDKDPNNNPSAVPLNDWLCIEWMHKGDTSDTKFWWDAVEHPSLATSKTVHGGNQNPYILPTFTNVWLGWQEYQTSSQTFELYLDEIALDKDRIGCVL